MYEFKKRIIKQKNPQRLPVHLKELWEERVAICMIDGGLEQERAEEIAWQEIERYENGCEQCDRMQ